MSDTSKLNYKLVRLNHMISEIKMMDAWTEVDLIKAHKIHTKLAQMSAPPPSTIAPINPYDIPICVSFLEVEFPDLTDECYSHMSYSFRDEQWRKTWVSMLQKMRKWHVDNMTKNTYD